MDKEQLLKTIEATMESINEIAPENARLEFKKPYNIIQTEKAYRVILRFKHTKKSYNEAITTLNGYYKAMSALQD